MPVLGGGYSVSPPTQTVVAGSPATITVTQLVISGSSQDFVLSDGGAGGVFSPTLLTLGPGVGSGSFTYANATPGSYAIIVAPSGGMLAAEPAQAVWVVVTAPSPPSPTSFTLTPASNSADVNVLTGAYTIELFNGTDPAVAGGGGQAFALTSSDLSGTFSPSSTATVPAGQSSVSFYYRSPNVGTCVLTATASGAPYAVNVRTAQAVISLPSGGIGGRMGPVIAAAGQEFGEAYLFGTLTNADDVPFAKLQSFDYKIATALKESMGPEQYSATGVGISDRKYTIDLQIASYSLKRYQLLLGGSAPAVQASVASPTAGPTLTPASGSTPFTAGHIAVGYAYRNSFGATVMSPLTDATVTSGQKITVTSLGALPAGVTSVDWFASSASYTTAPLAAAAPVYWIANNAGTSFDIVLYGVATAQVPLATSQILNAGYVQTHYAYDEPVPFTVHCMNPLDGSGRNLKVYGCVCTDLSNALKLRDWTGEKITGNVYGDTSVTPAKMHEWFGKSSFLNQVFSG